MFITPSDLDLFKEKKLQYSTPLISLQIYKVNIYKENVEEISIVTFIFKM